MFCSLFLPDPTFTLHNVTAVLESVEVHWSELVSFLNIWHLEMDRHSTPKKCRKAVIHYYLATSPYASWQSLAGMLYYREQAKAVEATQKYLHGSTG